MEKLQLEIIGKLCVLPRDTLVELCDFLIIAGPELEFVTGRSRTALMTLISNHIQREELDELEDKGMSELLHFQDKMSELQAVTSDTQVSVQERFANEEKIKKDQEREKIMKEIEALQLQLASTTTEKEKKVNKETNNMSSSKDTAQSTAISHAHPPWFKELKISGQIGEHGQKDKLTFSSLARQIEHGLSKGFPEPEIVDAVMRAISPGMQLRSYLEGKMNLTLPTLRRILRSYYQEKSPTDLYKQLTSEVQGIKETPQNFLIQAFDLRQKILFASQEAESGLKYDPCLVQNMFLHTVLTGLQSDNVKRDLQPYLEQTDSSLMNCY